MCLVHSDIESISEAWTEQTEQAADMTTKSDSDVTSPLSPGKPENKDSFFLTDRQMSRSLDFDEHQLTNPDDRGECGFLGLVGVVKKHRQQKHVPSLCSP